MSSSGLKRKSKRVYELDQFFTNPVIAQQCSSMIDIDGYDLCIEPSAGKGAFFRCLNPHKRIGLEIDEYLCKQNEELSCGSWFDYNMEPGNTLVIGNPPFGTQNSIAIQFFNHAAKFARTIAFIVPRTWKRDQVQNQLCPWFHLSETVDLHEEMGGGRIFQGTDKTNVKCCFQVWDRMESKREKVKGNLEHKDWVFLKYEERDTGLHPPANADFVVLAYGNRPGTVDESLHRWRPKSVHFIKSNIGIEELKARFNALDFSQASDSARQSSMGKQLLVKLYTERFGPPIEHPIESELGT